jgi:cytochrome c peroxidase
LRPSLVFLWVYNIPLFLILRIRVIPTIFVDMRTLAFLSTLLTIALLFGCTKEEPGSQSELPNPSLPLPDYEYGYPEMGPAYDNSGLPFFEATPEDNPVTNDGAALGRVLFYDTRLSANYTISCSSCHQQEHSFTVPKAKSKGLHGLSTHRNASHLINLRYNRRQFWDMRANTLEAQVLMPIQDPIEMGLSLEALIPRLVSTDYYPTLFENAFGTPEITTERISRALSQFIRSIVSTQSKYDIGVTNNFADYTAEELAGKALFFNNITRCNQCHMTGNFYTPQAFNNGLEYPYTDGGLFDVTNDEADRGKFKVPSLRNVALTGPYMHDGRFATLMDVINHYDHGVIAQPYLDDRLTTELVIGGTPYQLGLSESEKSSLIAFLMTLTDSTLLFDPRFSSPF